MNILIRRIVINILSQWGMQVGNVVISFALIAYALNWMSAEHYGGWAVIISIIGYVTMLDAGMSAAAQYYVARYSTHNDSFKLSSFYSATYIIYALAALISVVVCLVIAGYFSELFPKISEQSANESKLALSWVAAAMFLFMMAMPSQGALQGLQRHYISNAIEMFSLIVRFLVVVFMFNISYPSLEYLGMAFFCASVVKFILCLILIHYVSPQMKFDFSLINSVALKDVFSFGGHSTFWTISNVIIRESGPLVTAIVVGAKESTYIYVGIRLVRAVGVFIRSAAQVFLPVTASLYETRDLKTIRQVTLDGTKMCALMALSGMAVLIVFGEPVLFQWLGVEGLNAYEIVVLFSILMTVNWITNVQQKVVMGMRILWPITNIMLFRLTAGLLLSIWLGLKWGVEGVVLGLVLPETITNLIVIPWLIANHVGLKIIDNLKSLLIPIIICMITTIAALVTTNLWEPNKLAVLISECLVLLLLFIFMVFFFGIDQNRREVILQALVKNR